MNGSPGADPSGCSKWSVFDCWMNHSESGSLLTPQSGRGGTPTPVANTGAVPLG